MNQMSGFFGIVQSLRKRCFCLAHFFEPRQSTWKQLSKVGNKMSKNQLRAILTPAGNSRNCCLGITLESMQSIVNFDVFPPERVSLENILSLFLFLSDFKGNQSYHLLLKNNAKIMNNVYFNMLIFKPGHTLKHFLHVRCCQHRKVVNNDYARSPKGSDGWESAVRADSQGVRGRSGQRESAKLSLQLSLFPSKKWILMGMGNNQ